ncbi:NAD(P)-dependent oxidoreductase [Candidatus Poribacteria bacterium]|nr:NAD(P)-dependent oxidoreductase [Candidatus Poribacteria bacterium]MYK16940.1 NAD(P)-dependent oxidoreductase [Candidatus Poribacteria bacterium]
MTKVGLIGVGNMGMGMSRNILKAGHELTVYDVRSEPLEVLAKEGAYTAASPREVGNAAESVFIMVLNVEQVKAALLGEGGLLAGLKPGATIICTATIGRSQVIEVGELVRAKGFHIVDAPVSGGAPGAAAGTLTMMVAAPKEIYEASEPVLEAVGRDIYHVGEEVGMGQTVKSALAVLIGTTYAGIFEALTLAVKAGVKPETLRDVVSTSVVGNFLFRDTTENILTRNFRGQSNIGTMYKDLSLAKSMANDCGVPLFAASAAFELFQAGKAVNPDEDNWTIIKILENIAGIEIKKTE